MQLYLITLEALHPNPRIGHSENSDENSDIGAGLYRLYAEAKRSRGRVLGMRVTTWESQDTPLASYDEQEVLNMVRNYSERHGLPVPEDPPLSDSEKKSAQYKFVRSTVEAAIGPRPRDGTVNERSEWLDKQKAIIEDLVTRGLVEPRK